MMSIKNLFDVGQAIKMSMALAISLASAAPLMVTGDSIPLGLPPPQLSNDNPQTPEKITLGKKLFQDVRLSANGKISCAECHKPERAFTDGRTVSQGIHGQAGTRNAPSLFNVGYLTSLFWDGRRTKLEDQAKDPFVNSREHGLPNSDAVLSVIRKDNNYVEAFHKVFEVSADNIRMEHVVKALASFERSLLAGESPFDRYYYAGDKKALSSSARQGLDIFRDKARCISCHTINAQGALFTDNAFHSLGVGFDTIAPRLAETTKQVVGASARDIDQMISSQPDIAGLGRFVVTHKPVDIGRFRTPSLRNVALTAPYMHDGSVATLEEAVDLEIYYRTQEGGRPILITTQEKADLLAFLQSLTSANIAH